MAGDQDIGARLAATTGLPCRHVPLVFEGGAIDTDGTGLFVTTEQCLLNPNRNPTLGRAQIEALLAGALGLNNMLWLGDGLAHDHTDGHVDNLARFVSAGILAIPKATTDNDPNAAIYADAEARARAFRVEIAHVPSVGRYEIDGEIVPASYLTVHDHQRRSSSCRNMGRQRCGRARPRSVPSSRQSYCRPACGCHIAGWWPASTA